MRFDTYTEYENEIVRLEKKVEELERALASLHAKVIRGSCCEPELV